MNRYYYDLHIHSCLSPCGDDDCTPHNLAGMGALAGLQIMALTDHNTCRNCPAFFEATRQHGIVAVPGMELTTAEEVHMICLFPTLEAALAFDEEIAARRIHIPNRPEIFGNQWVMDAQDKVLAEEADLLSNATTVTIEESVPLAAQYGGIAYPAHIDREANGIVAVLGSLPETPQFSCVELHDGTRETEFRAAHGLEKTRVVVGSDAHYLWDIRDKERYLELDDTPYSSDLVRQRLIECLRRGL
ncbi:MAG: PHP domain-containing protein [Clostridia bacterium]|nr:PHP domain-containing protein [Loktanella sp.]MBQ1951199.1 PHP domain-containing protein [Clostridia bacterium]